MRAIQISSLAGPDAVERVDIPEPEAAADEITIDVKAVGVSFVDALMTRGQYQVRPELPFVPGVEVAGVVRSAPPGATVKAGDRCAAYVPSGGYAEVVVAKPATTFALPDELSFEQGAAFAMNFQTVHFALVRRGRLKAGEHVLIHGAAGGVGTAAIQVAKGLGAEVTAVVDSTAMMPVAEAAGADTVVVAQDDWADEVRATGPIDVTVDPVGGDYFADSIRLLRPEGRHLVIGFAAGGIPEIAVNRLLLKNIEVVGVYWGGFVELDDSIAATSAAELTRLAREGFVRPVVGAVYPLNDATKALQALEDRTASGKLVLKVGSIG
ncbi:NADPH:quinone oxidoreductase family protein [Amycolatopsis sp. EV170708-02-1]|uniref:NADPH:quinone oxidoreductase family protein n=1 Tax=Amycolatopsis sp. EV170708-02-1 TaxID=2919322 RepID=UPI001F0C905D|nr:NADPH:quinone oxidoreductase family protein [Amycolatopsis sp. EV170708-02-1]UMP00050.1 NADPH:quinone oxidoreductase family protein [Amycolatopsis sp. EV170708-02-1]